MEMLFELISKFAFELSPERLALIADKFYHIESVDQIQSMKSVWGPNVNKERYQEFLLELRKHPNLTGRELSAAFRSALAVVKLSETQGRQELIWTGPATTSMTLRQTEQALCEVINAAQKTLFLVSFVAYKAENVISALTDALMRNVEINFLLESSKEHGGVVDIDSLELLKTNFPSAIFYEWNKARNPDSASVHAKCAIADDSMALITSANLTGKAMSSNMELGVLIRNGILPKQLFSHLNKLVIEKIITPVDGI